MDKEQLAGTLRMVYEIMAEDAFTDALATMMWNIYTKNKAKGFTDDQAMEICLHFARSMSKGN